LEIGPVVDKFRQQQAVNTVAALAAFVHGEHQEIGFHLKKAHGNVKAELVITRREVGHFVFVGIGFGKNAKPFAVDDRHREVEAPQCLRDPKFHCNGEGVGQAQG